LFAVALCGAAAAQAAPDCAALARPPTWAECAAEFSVEAAAAFDRPSQLQFDDDAAAAVAASMDLTQLAIKPSGPPQVGGERSAAVAAIPEPHTNLLMVAGLVAIAFMAARRRRP
jgi:hypothetical protein